MNRSKIQYTDFTWNPFVGCKEVSSGCKNCFAKRLATTRLAHLYPYNQATDGVNWSNNIRMDYAKIRSPFHRKKPSVIFCGDMGDIFHEDMKYEDLVKIYAVMLNCPQHLFLVLTKRPEGFERFTTRLKKEAQPGLIWETDVSEYLTEQISFDAPRSEGYEFNNVYHGVSIESNKHLDRITKMIGYDQPFFAKNKFWVSLEPLLEKVVLPPGVMPHLCQVVVGGESGRGARPCEQEWFEAIGRACGDEKVPCLFKQPGSAFVGSKQELEESNLFDKVPIWKKRSDRKKEESIYPTRVGETWKK